MKKVILGLLLSAPISAPIFAQLVAFTGRESNSPETWAFVALQDIPDGTRIFFTGDDYDNSTDAFGTEAEGNVMFTVSGTLSTGTVVQIQETASDVFSVTGNGGTAVHVVTGSGDWSISSGDPLYAFGSSSNTDPAGNVTEIYAMLWITNAAFGTRDPSPDFPNAIVVDNGFSGPSPSADFTGSRCATHASLADSSNFTEGDNMLDLTTFTCVPVELSNISIE